jgi:hypothetical protein
MSYLDRLKALRQKSQNMPTMPSIKSIKSIPLGDALTGENSGKVPTMPSIKSIKSPSDTFDTAYTGHIPANLPTAIPPSDTFDTAYTGHIPANLPTAIPPSDTFDTAYTGHILEKSWQVWRGNSPAIFPDTGQACPARDSRILALDDLAVCAGFKSWKDAGRRLPVGYEIRETSIT